MSLSFDPDLLRRANCAGRGREILKCRNLQPTVDERECASYAGTLEDAIKKQDVITARGADHELLQRGVRWHHRDGAVYWYMFPKEGKKEIDWFALNRESAAT